MVEFEVKNQSISKPRKIGTSFGFCCLRVGQTPAFMGKLLSHFCEPPSGFQQTFLTWNVTFDNHGHPCNWT